MPKVTPADLVRKPRLCLPKTRSRWISASPGPRPQPVRGFNLRMRCGSIRFRSTTSLAKRWVPAVLEEE